MMGTEERFVDGSGQSVQLGAALGRGGEGAVFELIGIPDRVAKIYHAPSRVRERKLQAMVGLGNPDLLRMSAWPEYTLHKQPGGPVVGFGMARAEGASLSDLLGPGSRRAQFPHSSFQFVVHAARNLAAACSTAHAAKAVIGDVKEMNAYVSDTAMVTLLDTDGFQVTNPVSGEVFRIQTVTPSHQPPELQGASDLSKLIRMPEQDAFGLAVLIFQLLFMGRHPFSGTPVTRVDLEIHDAIQARQFAWAADLPNRLYRQPPFTLGLAAVGSLAPLFTRAFLNAQPKERPSSAEWVTSLARYEQELRVCEANSAHAHIGPVCVLCEVEAATGAVLFLRPRASGTIKAPLDLIATWALIVLVSPPGPAPALPAPLALPAPPTLPVPPPPLAPPAPPIAAVSVPARKVRWWAVLFGGLVAQPVQPPAQLIQPTRSQPLAANAARADAVMSARRRVDDLRRRWARETGELAFSERLKVLELTRDRLRLLAAGRAQRLQVLRADLPQQQREHYLRAHSIARAHIDGLSAKHINTLRSFRIETAYDITDFNLGWVHVFGSKLQGNLAAWRQEIEGTFRFDVSKGMDSDDIRALEEEFADKRFADEQLLRLGPTALKQLSDYARRSRIELLPQIQAAQVELAQAQANLRATS